MLMLMLMCSRCKRCKCGCGMFTSNFACVVYDLKWEDHETVFETGRERAMEGRPTGDAYFPLANDSQIRDMVFPGGGAKNPEGTESPTATRHIGRRRPHDPHAPHDRPDPRTTRPRRPEGPQDPPTPKTPNAPKAHGTAPSRYRPQQVDQRFAEKSVQISHASSGGAISGQQVANRWGQVDAPPEEWLYQGGGGGPGGGGRSPGDMDSLPARPGSRSVGGPSKHWGLKLLLVAFALSMIRYNPSEVWPPWAMQGGDQHLGCPHLSRHRSQELVAFVQSMTRCGHGDQCREASSTCAVLSTVGTGAYIKWLSPCPL
eukprot:gene2132-18179_t